MRRLAPRRRAGKTEDLPPGEYGPTSAGWLITQPNHRCPTRWRTARSEQPSPRERERGSREADPPPTGRKSTGGVPSGVAAVRAIGDNLGP